VLGKLREECIDGGEFELSELEPRRNGTTDERGSIGALALSGEPASGGNNGLEDGVGVDERIA
jgi:hypothetical protein